MFVLSSMHISIIRGDQGQQAHMALLGIRLDIRLGQIVRVTTITIGLIIIIIFHDVLAIVMICTSLSALAVLCYRCSPAPVPCVNHNLRTLPRRIAHIEQIPQTTTATAPDRAQSSLRST